MISKRRILLVDDDLLTITTIAQVLRNAGYETAEATSGDEALKIALEFCPDLALLDIVMPGMSGIELAERLQADANIPFMFISAHSGADIVMQATQNGAVGYLLKPFDIAQIIPVVETGLCRANDIKHLKDRETSLTAALASGRETSIAVGILMTKFQTDRNSAFEALRTYSRSNRLRINDVADSILSAEEMLNGLGKFFK